MIFKETKCFLSWPNLPSAYYWEKLADYMSLQPCLHTYLDDGGDELFQEIVAQQWWPVMMDEVNQQALNVGTILIL